MIWIGMLIGLCVSLIGSLIISLYPYIPFVPMFLATIFPSIIVFVTVSYLIKPNSTKFKCWLNGFVCLFIVAILAFMIKNYFEVQAIANNPATSMNWDAVIIANILYSLGAAMILSPIGYLAIRKLVTLKMASSTS